MGFTVASYAIVFTSIWTGNVDHMLWRQGSTSIVVEAVAASVHIDVRAEGTEEGARVSTSQHSCVSSRFCFVLICMYDSGYGQWPMGKKVLGSRSLSPCFFWCFLLGFCS